MTDFPSQCHDQGYDMIYICILHPLTIEVCLFKSSLLTKVWYVHYRPRDKAYVSIFHQWKGIDLKRTFTFCFPWTFISKNFLFEIGMEKASRNATKKFRFSRKYFNLYSNSLQSWEYFELRAIFLSWLRAVDTTQIISIQIQYWEGLFKKCLDNKTLSSSISVSLGKINA